MLFEKLACMVHEGLFGESFNKKDQYLDLHLNKGFLYPLSFKIRAQLNPMNPAPPVISIFIKLDKVWVLYAFSDLFLSK